jgi:hypothetical protein
MRRGGWLDSEQACLGPPSVPGRSALGRGNPLAGNGAHVPAAFCDASVLLKGGRRVLFPQSSSSSLWYQVAGPQRAAPGRLGTEIALDAGHAIPVSIAPASLVPLDRGGPCAGAARQVSAGREVGLSS